MQLPRKILHFCKLSILMTCMLPMPPSTTLAADFSTIEARTPSLPWVTPGKPLAKLGEVMKDNAVLARIYGGWDRENLYLRIEVEDHDHVAARNDRTLWSADSVEIGIDAAGNGSWALPPETSGPIDANDIKLIFGLLESGPAISLLAALDKPDVTELMTLTDISHDPASGTTYSIALPWSWLKVTGGTHPTIGLDVQINDRNPSDDDKIGYPWGQGLQGGYTASKLKAFPLGTPEDAFIALAWADTLTWNGQSPSHLLVGSRSDVKQTIHLRLDGKASTVTVPNTTGFQFKSFTQPAQPDGALLSAQVGDQPAVTAQQTNAKVLYQKLQDRLDALLARPDQDPLFVRHLQSLKDLTADDWVRCQSLKISNPRRALESLEHYQSLLIGFNADAADWDAYLDGRRSLVIAYTSDYDQTLQYYLLSLPQDWDPAVAYPLFFELHGAGNDHPMASFSDRLAATAKRQDGYGYESPKVYAEIERSGYWVHPFGRGNKRYVGVARIDVLEAYDDAHALLKIDPGRRYLYGFSMGGQGTYTLGARTPSRWAAACSIAAGMRGDTADSPIAANWSLLPYKIMCGEEDRLFPAYQEILAALARYDIHPEARSIEGLGHTYRADLQQEKIEWLKSHVRTRPEAFTFVTDDNLTNACWGITLIVPEKEGALARVEYRREGQTLNLRTEGTTEIQLDPSEPDGLGLSGDITVIWNGNEVYRGPAQLLTLNAEPV